jgi:hypothetical protein
MVQVTPGLSASYQNSLPFHFTSIHILEHYSSLICHWLTVLKDKDCPEWPVHLLLPLSILHFIPTHLSSLCFLPDLSHIFQSPVYIKTFFVTSFHFPAWSTYTPMDSMTTPITYTPTHTVSYSRRREPLSQPLQEHQSCRDPQMWKWMFGLCVSGTFLH